MAARVRLEQRAQSVQNTLGGRRIAADQQIHRQCGAHAVGDGVAALEDPAVNRAVPDRHDELRFRHSGVGLLDRIDQIACNRPGHQQHIGVARRDDQADAEALQIVDRTPQRAKLDLAAATTASVEMQVSMLATPSMMPEAAGRPASFQRRPLIGAGPGPGRRGPGDVDVITVPRKVNANMIRNPP